MKPEPPAIDPKRAFAVLRKLKDALIVIEGRALFVSGGWENPKSDYVKLMREWPVTEVGFHREKAPGYWKIIGPLLTHNFVLELEDPGFLVNVFRIFKMDRSVAAWSIDNADRADFKEALLAESLEPGGSNTKFGGDLIQFAQNLFWIHILEDIGYDEPFLFLHCGEKVPRKLKRIVTDNNLEPYIEGVSNN